MKERKPHKYWESPDNVLAEARKVMEEHSFDTLPNGEKLCKLGYASLTQAITRYHRGFHEFRKLLEKEPKRVKNGIWKDIDYTIQYAKQIMQEHNFETLPSYDKLYELGHSSLATAIITYHRGFPEFRKSLGQEKLQGRWKDLEYTIQQAKELMKKHGFKTLPSQRELCKLGYSSLNNAINRYYDGLHAFRGLLNKTLGTKTQKQELTELLKGYARQ